MLPSDQIFIQKVVVKKMPNPITTMWQKKNNKDKSLRVMTDDNTSKFVVKGSKIPIACKWQRYIWSCHLNRLVFSITYRDNNVVAMLGT